MSLVLHCPVGWLTTQQQLSNTHTTQCMQQEWYRNFVGDMDRDMIFEILGAANYMNIKPLLDLACLRVTFELTGKTAEEVSALKMIIATSKTTKNGL